MEDDNYPRYETRPINTIIRFTIPQIQRTIDEDHINNMYEKESKFWEANHRLSILQTITVCSCDGKFYVLDGQHRIKMFDKMIKTGYNIGNEKLNIVLDNANTMKELLDKYRDINSNKPISPIELTEDWEKYGKYISESMMKMYPSYIQMLNGRSCVRLPKISYESLKDALQHRSIILKEMDPKVVLEKIEYINSKLGKIRKLVIDHDTDEKMNKCENLKKRANEKVLYLRIMGDDHSYLDLAIKMIKDGLKTIEDCGDIKLINFIPDRRNQGLPKGLRISVWNKRNDPLKDQALCFVCEQKINKDDYECGHIVSKKLGGSDNIDNLEPICKMCNVSMGIQNLLNYKQMYYSR